MKLTKTRVQELKADGKRQYVYDDELPGFGVVVQPTGAKSFFIQFRTPGGRSGDSRRVIIGSFPKLTVELARNNAREKLALAAMGKDPSQDRREEKEAITVLGAIEEFLDLHVRPKLKPSTVRNYTAQARLHVIPAIGRLKVKEVTHTHLARLHHGLRAAPYQANRTLAMLSKFFGWCEMAGYRDQGTNPAARIGKFKEQKQVRFMDADALGKVGSSLAVLEAGRTIDPFAAAAIRTLLFTGARLNEVLTLQWGDVDLERGIAHVRDSKTGAKVIRLGTPAVALLGALPRLNDWVFPSRRKDGPLVNLRKPWVAVCDHAGVGTWRLHDLRHAFASVAASEGHSLPVVGALLGHTQAQTTARYSHVGDNPIHKAAEDASQAVQKALNSGKVATIRGGPWV